MQEYISIHAGNPIIARYYDYEYFKFPMHYHSQFEIIFVKEGFGKQYVADSVEDFRPNTIILTGPETQHYMESDLIFKKGDSPLKVKGVVIQFDKRFMAEEIDNYDDLSHIKKLLEESKRGISFPYPKNSEIIRQIELLPQMKGLERIINLLRLLDTMARFESRVLLGSIQFSNPDSAFKDYRIKKVMSYISTNFRRRITLEEVASLIAMNTAAFSRYFKEKTGHTFTDYLLNMRIGEARQLLLTASMDINQISLECGFNNITHFNRIFKRYTTLTPSEYRKMYLK